MIPLVAKPGERIKTQSPLTYNVTIHLVDSGLFGFALGAVSTATVLPLFINHLTDSALLIALIPTIHLLGWHLPQLLTVPHVARLQRYLPFFLKTTLHRRVPFLLLALLALFLPYLSTTVVLALTFLLLLWQSLGGGISATAWQSLLAKLIPPSRRGLFFGSQFAVTALGGVVAATWAGSVLSGQPYPMNFAILFGVAGVVMMVAWGLLHKTEEAPHHVSTHSPKNSARLIRRMIIVLSHDHDFVWYLLGRWFLQLSLMGSAFYTIYALEQQGVDEWHLGLYTGAMLAIQVLLNPLVGWLGDKIGYRLVMVLGTLAIGVSACLSWAAPSGEWFLLVFILLGIGNVSYWAPNLAFVLDFAPRGDRQLYIGLANTLVTPALLATPFIGSWLLTHWGYPSLFIVSALCSLVAALLLFFLVQDRRRSSTSASVEMFHFGD